ncbi:putative polyamine transporter [Mollisia scopiformis]|uniref:Putative polyamine transporter n=1 Tax=Mollisia scopiformis TaxID=149040 RepID=A0A194WV78_MOLSC|nr:putative polyamine transporter [Mollisia scopiformis]KUJ11873.1 putative polyamine transporter [Mollisia scopiformis]
MSSEKVDVEQQNEVISTIEKPPREPTDFEIVEGKRSKKGLLLRPQPSNDPNDPLNWPALEKYSTYLTVCFFAFLGLVNSSNFTVAIVPVAKEFHTTTTRAGYLTSIQLLFMGLGNLFWMPLMRITGKRPVYLSSLLLLVITNIWGYFAHSYGSLLASRIVGGFMSAAADATVPAVVADLFYFHERGHCMMVFHTAISAGVFLGPLINAYIVQYAGWRWMLGFMSIAAGVTFSVGLFSIHETAYKRDEAALDLPEQDYAPKRSWWKALSLVGGYDRTASFWKWLGNTLVLLAYPPVLFVGLTIGVFVGWNISIQLTSSRVFTAAPYHWQIHDLGLLSTSAFVGAIISFFIGGRLIDFIANHMTARAGGHPEPEFRLPAMIFPAIIGPMGVLTFGLVVGSGKSYWGAAVGFGGLGFGLTAASNVVVTYAVDAYRAISGEVLVIVFVVRNVMACILSLYIADWIKKEGIKKAFGEMVVIQYAILSLSVVLYFWGKRIRAWTATFGPMKKVLMREV